MTAHCSTVRWNDLYKHEWMRSGREWTTDLLRVEQVEGDYEDGDDDGE